MSTESLIISVPEQQGTLQRRLYTALTALAWFAWGHLWLPVITLAAWAVGIDLVYQKTVLDDAAHGIDDLVFLLRAGTLCAALFFAWASYNRWRYGGAERRGAIENTPQAAIADYFGASEIVSDRLRRMRRTVLHVDANGRPIRAVVDPPTRCALPIAAAGDDEHGYDLRPTTCEHPEELAPVE